MDEADGATIPEEEEEEERKLEMSATNVNLDVTGRARDVPMKSVYIVSLPLAGSLGKSSGAQALEYRSI